MTLPAFSVRGARVRFADGGSFALPHVVVASGELVAVVGRNGAGKSALMRALVGLVDVEGEIERRVDPRDVAFVPARPFLFRRSAVENVALALEGRGLSRDERRRRALATLLRCGASDLAERGPRALSEGQLQRVALARALVTEPSALLLDEPFGPLDAAGVAFVSSLLTDRGGRTVVVTSPTAEALRAAGARVVELR